MNVLRQEDRFNYEAFRQKLRAQQFNPGQKTILDLLLSLLHACLAGVTQSNSMTTHFRQGQLTHHQVLEISVVLAVAHPCSQPVISIYGRIFCTRSRRHDIWTLRQG
jgi:hypothetical protein